MNKRGEAKLSIHTCEDDDKSEPESSNFYAYSDCIADIRAISEVFNQLLSFFWEWNFIVRFYSSWGPETSVQGGGKGVERGDSPI